MLPIGICAYAIPYSIGFIGRGTAQAIARPLSGYDLLELARRDGLRGVELPLSLIAPDYDPYRAADAPPPQGESDAALDAYAGAARNAGIALTVDTPPLDADAMAVQLRAAKRVGARVVRTMLSSVLCGDRSRVGGAAGWQQVMDERIQVLKTVAPLAEELDIRIGIENHQDATSRELAALCRAVNSSHVGVTLDTGNPLAVAEDPVAFAVNILPHLVHVHLKDYHIAATPAGYQLYHCAIGDGVVDFPALFDLFGTVSAFAAGEINLNIEMAMLGERHIRMLEDEYWAGYDLRPAAELLPVLRLRDTAPRIEERPKSWLTPWDRSETAHLAEWEMERLAASVANMQRVARP